MPRKRIHVSLDADSQDDEELRRSFQIVFTLVPDGVSGLYSTCHPIIWKVWDLRYGEPMILDCNTEVGVCTAKKESSGKVVPVIGRFVPAGHYTAVTRIGGVLSWTDTKWWHQDTFNSILIHNDSKSPQAFALCSSFINEDEHEPSLHPILLFNQISDDKPLKIKTRLRLQAWYGGSNLEQWKQRRKNDGLRPVETEDGSPWIVDVEDSLFSSSYTIYRNRHGKVGIRNNENARSQREYSELRGDLRSLEERLNDLARQVGYSQNGTSDSQDVQKQIEELRQKTSNLKHDLEGSKQNHDELRSAHMGVQAELKECRGDIQILQEARLSGAQPTDGTGQVAQLCDDIREMEKKVEELTKSVKEVPTLQDVERVHEVSNQAMEEAQRASHSSLTLKGNIDSTDQHLKELQGFVATSEKRMKGVETKVEGATTSIAITNGKVEEVKKELKQTQAAVRTVTLSLDEKAEKKDVSGFNESMGRIVRTVRGLEGMSVGLRSSVGGLTQRVEGAEREVGRIKEQLPYMVRR